MYTLIRAFLKKTTSGEIFALLAKFLHRGLVLPYISLLAKLLSLYNDENGFLKDLPRA